MSLISKFITMTKSWFNFGIDQLTDPIKIAELKIQQNKDAINKSAELAASLYAEYKIINRKISTLKNEIKNHKVNINYAAQINDDVKGKNLMSKLIVKEKYLETLKEQVIKVKEQREKLEDIIDKVKLKNDMLTTELNINKTKAKSSGSIKSVLETLKELDNDEIGGVMEDIERIDIKNGYQIDKYLDILDQPDTEIDEKWQNYKNSK